MNRDEKQEIRRVLMGRTMLANDGRLVALEKGQYNMPIGITDGAVAARFLGITGKARRLNASCSKEKARSLAVSVMQDVGRGLYLPQQPEAVACLIRYVLTKPAVLVFRYEEDIPVLSAWAGRGLTGWISLRRALNSFIKRLPKQLTVSDEPVPTDKDEETRKERKQRKKLEKKEKKKNRRNSAQNAASDDTLNTMEEHANESES